MDNSLKAQIDGKRAYVRSILDHIGHLQKMVREVKGDIQVLEATQRQLDQYDRMGRKPHVSMLEYLYQKQAVFEQNEAENQSNQIENGPFRGIVQFPDSRDDRNDFSKRPIDWQEYT